MNDGIKPVAAGESAVTAKTAEDHIRRQAKQKKTLSQKERVTVARNVHKILERAKDEGVSKSQLATKMHLGGGQAKELHPFYLPAEKKERRLIAKAAGYIRLLESLAAIEGHSRSGSTSDLLREAFNGTSYWDRSASGEDLVADLYGIIQECRSWLIRDGEVVRAYELFSRLARPAEAVQGYDEDLAVRIYRMAFTYPKSLSGMTLQPPRFYIGTRYTPAVGETGEQIVLCGNGEIRKPLYNANEYFIYLGPNREGSIELQLVEEKTLSFEPSYPKDEPKIEFILDADFGDGIMIQSIAGSRYEVIGQDYKKLVPCPVKRRDANCRNKHTAAFIEAYPDLCRFGNEYGMLVHPGDIRIVSISMDRLDDLGKEFYGNTSQLLPFSGMDVVQPDLQLRYGRSALTRLLAFFLYPWIPEGNLPRMDLAKKLKILQSARPPAGWTHPERHSAEAEESFWSIPDALLVEAKLFCKLINAGYEKETAQAENRLSETMSKLSDKTNMN